MSGESFATWLERELKARRITQATLAHQIGVHPGTVSRWVAEERIPRAGILEQIALVLGLPVDDVLVAAGVLSEDRARVGPRARLMDLIHRLPDEETATVLAFVEFRMQQYRQAMRLESSRTTSTSGVSGGIENNSGVSAPG